MQLAAGILDGCDGTWTIKAGDTFYRLARAVAASTGLNIGDIASAIAQCNQGTDPHTLQINQLIAIPKDVESILMERIAENLPPACAQGQIGCEPLINPTVEATKAIVNATTGTPTATVLAGEVSDKTSSSFSGIFAVIGGLTTAATVGWYLIKRNLKPK